MAPAARATARKPTRPSLSASGLRTFENIAERWQLSPAERQQILGVSPSTYYRLKRDPAGARLDDTTLERISHILGIYKALHVLFPDAARADGWIDRPNRAFGGAPARARLTTGLVSDLAYVRRYLDVHRGW